MNPQISRSWVRTDICSYCFGTLELLSNTSVSYSSFVYCIKSIDWYGSIGVDSIGGRNSTVSIHDTRSLHYVLYANNSLGRL
jgi:hypothetical protein